MSTIDLIPGGLPFSVTGDENVLEAITTNGPFPSSAGKVVIGQLGFKTPEGSWSMPGMGNQPVTFTASATTSSEIAAYTDAGQLATDLGFQSADGKQLKLDLPNRASSRYMALSWTLGANAAGSGKLVLSPMVSVDLGATGEVNSQFTFVRILDTAEKAGDACRSLVTGWMTPGEIATGKSVPDGCWIITEVDGSLGANLGVEAGYSLSWIKDAGLNQLDGDIGLRVQLGLQATLTASVSGKFYVVINRDLGATATRVRIFRDRSNGWGFALNSSAEVTPSTSTLTPQGLTDLIKAILGTHDAQLLDFLSDASSLDSAAGITNITNELGNDLLTKFGVAGDVKSGFSELSELLTKWNDLGSSVSATIWKYADNVTALSDLHAAANALANASDDSMKTILDGYLHDAAFSKSPIGEWLENASSSTLLQLYESSPKVIQVHATKLLSVLDGSDLQAKLGRLKAELQHILDLTTLQTALQAGDLGGIATWVQERLAKFLGIDKTHLPAQLPRVAKAIDTLQIRAGDIYSATVKALNTTYGATFTGAYQASDENSALVDASFEDSEPAAHTAMKEVLLGNLGAVLANPVQGVKLAVATLTHSLSRHIHVEAHLPWWTGAADDLATATASANFVDGVNGRVQFFECSATDVATTQRNTELKRFATCSLGLSGTFSGVRTYDPQAVNFGYTFLTERTGMTPAQLRYELKSAVDQYLPKVFGTASGSQHASFESWVSELGVLSHAAVGNPDRTGVLGTIAAGATIGPDRDDDDQVLGTVWSSLQVSMNAQDASKWISKLLAGVQPDYHAMSCSMQQSIRRWLLTAYGANPENFRTITTSQTLLVYASLPPLNEMLLNGDELSTVIAPKGDIVWDTLDPNMVRAVCEAYALPGLNGTVQRAVDLLSGIPSLKGSIRYYLGRQSEILNEALRAEGGGNGPLSRLLQAEKKVIDDAHSAFKQLQGAAKSNISKALPQFTEALISLTETFNKELAALSMSAPEVMRNFAPIILRQAVQDMFGGGIAPVLDAVLDIAVLKTQTLPPTGIAPIAGDTLVRQHITSFA